MVQRSSLIRSLLLPALALTQCKGSAESQGTTQASASASAQAVASAPAPPSKEVPWERVTSDPIDLAALGREIGAKRCVAEVVSGGEHGGEALQVLPFTPDAESQLGALCDTLQDASATQRTERLASIARTLARGAADREVVEAAGLKRCAALLKAAQTAASGSDRDYIESALEQLASRHVGAP